MCWKGNTFLAQAEAHRLAKQARLARKQHQAVHGTPLRRFWLRVEGLARRIQVGPALAEPQETRIQ